MEALYGKSLEQLVVENLSYKQQVDLAINVLGARYEANATFFPALVESIDNNVTEMNRAPYELAQKVKMIKQICDSTEGLYKFKNERPIE